MPHRFSRSLFGTGLLLTSAAIAQPMAPPADNPPANPPHEHAMGDMGAGKIGSIDHHFVMEALQGGAAEVDLGKLAAEKGSNPDVKAFGQRMVDDHSRANDQLRSLATSKGIKVSDHMSADAVRDRGRLGALSGAAFDRAYMRMMVKDHETDVAAFKRAAGRDGGDADIKGFAQSTLPTLEDHLKMARDVDGKVRGGTTR
jgi:putative membrane protein